MAVPQTTTILQKGSTGDEVAELQKKLKDAGFDPGAADGIYGEKTEKAVMDFQLKHELYDDGVAGAHFQETLDNFLDSDSFILSQRYLKRGLRGDDVLRLQEMLSAIGFDAGTSDGIFGGQTVKALVEFQKANGLGADGICGPKTVETLVASYDALMDEISDGEEYDFTDEV